MMNKACHLISWLLFFSFVFTHLSGQTNEEVSLKNKNKAKISYNKGIQSIQEEDYMAALEHFSTSLDFNPQFDLAYLMRGKSNLELQDLQAAIVDFNMAIEMNNILGEAYFYRGYTNLDVEPEVEVLDDLSRAIDNGYKESFAYYYRGLYYLIYGESV